MLVPIEKAGIIAPDFACIRMSLDAGVLGFGGAGCIAGRASSCAPRTGLQCRCLEAKMPRCPTQARSGDLLFQIGDDEAEYLIDDFLHVHFCQNVVQGDRVDYLALVRS